MTVVLKVVCVILSERPNDAFEEHDVFSPAQAACWRLQERVTQAACLVDIIQRRRLVDQPAYVVFIDFKKAYDMVPHGHCLSQEGVRGKCLALIKAPLYAGSTTRVQVGGGTQAMYSDLCSLRRGVRQGCLLSPVLFNAFIDNLAIGRETMGVKVPEGVPLTWQ